MEQLTERQKSVLKQLIEAHIQIAQPVGSRFLTENFGIGYSPATVRHEMGALEEMGYLAQPHTSSGRIPTDTGYRYYVDYCISPGDLWDRDFYARLDRMFSKTPEENLETYADKVSGVLSEISREVGIIVIKDASGEAVDPTAVHKMLVHGTAHIIDKPEFQDKQKIRSLFEAFEEKSKLSHWISQRTQEQGVTVLIGRENEPEAFWECSIISTRLLAQGGGEAGSIAVMGPRRMSYARILPLVEKTAEMIEKILSWNLDERV